MKLPEAAFALHTVVLGKTRAGKSTTMRGFVEDMLDAGKPVCILDPKGDWWGLKSSADGRRAGYPVIIFGGDHADVPINEHSGGPIAELVATGNRPCIIDLSKFTVGERTRFFVGFAQALFAKTKGRRWLVIDECHNFAPQGKILDVDAGKMLHWANRLASEGGGKGISLISASQRPQKVHKDYLTCHETLIAMRVIHPLDRGAMKDWIDGCPDPAKGKEVLASLAEMPRGEGWVWSPEIKFGPKLVKFPMFKTFDSFKPAENGEADPKGWATVDLDEITAKLATVAKDAADNDPKLLKRRIAELEHQTKGRGAGEAELTAAHSEGLATGRAQGRQEGFAAGVAAMRRLAVESVHGAAPVAPIDWAVALPAARKSVDVAPAARPARAAVAASGSKLSKAEARVLTALAQYPDGRTKSQVAILTGYAGSGGGFNNALSALRTAARISGAGENLRITDQGLADLGPYDPLPHGSALLEHWRGQLSKAERACLDAVTAEYPRALSKDQVAEITGYEAGGGGFNNALSRLRTLELIEGRGEIKASDSLFG